MRLINITASISNITGSFSALANVGAPSQDWTVWTTIVQRIAVEHLLNPPRINFDLEATPFQLEQHG